MRCAYRVNAVNGPTMVCQSVLIAPVSLTRVSDPPIEP